MRIVESSEGNVVILAPEGEWDAETSPEFKAAASALADAGRIHFAIDFGKVSFIDSSALSALVSLFKKVNPTRKGEVKLFGMSAEIRGIFKETRLDRVFEIAATFAELRDKFPRDRD